jgi:transcriptional regulator with XRE-family HTH domain
MDLLIKNLGEVMLDRRYDSQEKLSQATGISQSHIGNILRRDKVPSILKVQQIAEGVGLKTWQLLLPTEALRSGIDSRFNALLDSYLSSDPKGQDLMLEVARGLAANHPKPASPES